MDGLKKFARRIGFRSANPPAPVAIEAKPELGQFVWLLNRQPTQPYPVLIESAAPLMEDDTTLIERVISAYKSAIRRYEPSGSAWDREIAEIKKKIHETLLAGDVRAVGKLLRDPANSTLFWGFDAIAKAPPGFIEPHETVIRTLCPSEDWRFLYALWLFDALNALGEALGARRLSYLETDPENVGCHDAGTRTVDDIVDQIGSMLGTQLQFPNPFPGELGLSSRRGVIGFRTIQAIYQAWRIRQITNGNPAAKVLEIGAGLGRTAYYANRLGISNYTIVDIPLTNAAQGYFLGRVLGSGAVRLCSEQCGGPLLVTPFSEITTTDPYYDLIVNVDSWTEMSPDVAERYWTFARSATRTVLSINHEHNPLTIRSMYSKNPEVRVSRYPYWVRKGYVEEIITW